MASDLNVERHGSDSTFTFVPVSIPPNTMECRVLLLPEEDGGFSAHAIRLPGVVSEGETVEEALDNIRDAFATTVATYREDQEPIPWSDKGHVHRVSGCIEKWILVNG